MTNIKSQRSNYNLIIHAVFIILCILFIIPILYIISISFTPNSSVYTDGYRLIPKEITTLAYEYVFRTPKQLINSYAVTGFVTIAGTAISLLITTMLSYIISRQDFKYRNPISFFIFFTMLFNGGLIPTYLLIIKYLHLKNNIWVLILPYVVNAWFVLIMKSFLASIPFSLIESAKIEGAGEFRTFFTIVIPLSKSALATVGLLIAFNYWNDWWLSLLYIDKSSLFSLQFLLYRTMKEIEALRGQLAVSMHVDLSKVPDESARMVMCLLAAGPVTILFPFFQKYLVKGITIGAIKG